MNRTRGIIIAASLTGLILITILALGFGSVTAHSKGSDGLSLTSPQLTFTGNSTGDFQQELKAWQNYSHELEQTVRVMQERETSYQQQLESANQTIVQLQDEINNANLLRSRSFFEEHESHEFGEFDD